MEHKLARLLKLTAQDFNAGYDPGTPGSAEFRRLSGIRVEIKHNRDTTLRLCDDLNNTYVDIDAYRLSLPASKPAIRPPISRRMNQFMADFRQAQDHADRMTELLDVCDNNLGLLQTQVDREHAATPPSTTADAATAADAPGGTPEHCRTHTGTSSPKADDTSGRPKQPDAHEFGDTTPPHSEARWQRKAGGTPPPSRSTGPESIFGPFRSDAATSSSSPSHAPSTPLTFTAEGKRLLTTKDTGPDFSLYGSNPFYLNSSVKLPIPVDYTYSSTKEPLVSQKQLPMLAPETFNGNFLLYAKFCNAFIRMVHAPGRHMSDAERLCFLVGSLKGAALLVVATYSSSHVTARYYKPFQACRVLHKFFLELRPTSGTAVELNRFADETIATVRLLRDNNDDLAHEKLAVEAWMEKIPQAVRLEMCRYFDPTSQLTLEDAVRALQKYTSWQLNASVFADTCGLGAQFKSVTGVLKAILAPPSSGGPTIVKVMEDERGGGFFGTPKGYYDVSKASCVFYGQQGDHWAPRCPVLKIISARLQRAAEFKFSLLCLRAGHSIGSQLCRARPTTCRFCRNAAVLAQDDQPTREPTDGLAKPSTTSTDVPDTSNGQRCAEHQVVSPPEMHQLAASLSEDGSRHATRDAAFPPNGIDSDSIGHDNDAPTDPDTDKKEFDYDACAQDALLNGVGTFGAGVPSGPELRRDALLECVTAEVFNPVDPSRKETVIVFFDCGSSQTFVSDKLADALGLINQGRKQLTLDTFANEDFVQLDIFQTTIGLVTTNRERIVLDAAASPPVVHSLRGAFISPEDVSELRRNNCTLIPVNVAPDIVIGRDIQHHFRKKDLLPLLPSGFCLVQNTLGTMVAGLGHVSTKTADGTPSASQTPDDQLAHERFKQTTRIDDEGRYQCRLPWKTPDGEAPSNVILPTDHAVARGRLTSLQRSHLSKPEFLLQYGEGFTTKEHDGIIEQFVPAERNSAVLHFLAHHAVIKESSATTKVRHVFDGSAKLPGKPSINDLLHHGPVLLPKMAAILVRTRLSQLLLIADIAKAFLQVSLHPANRSACAFIWLKDPLKPPSDDNLVYYRFRRVTFGLKPSPFLLGATIEMHLEKIGTPLAKKIWSSCYVDNVILGADTLEEAQEKYHLSKEYFASAKMQLRQFASNCSLFNAQLPPEDAAELRHLMNLGYEWDVASDCWRISLAARPAKGKPKGRKRHEASALRELTKRQMLQRVARVFDPIGYLQAVMLPAKLDIQEAWRARPGWDDDPVPDKLTELWAEATKDFEVTTINIPRRISNTKIDCLEVHIYVDASKEAYGCATCLRVPADGHFKASLVFSRAKVKPLKDAERMTIPRMELMAFVLGARQARFMAETLKLSGIRRTIIWSDSMIVLQQIRTPTKSKEIFVENRLSEIRTLQAELRFETRYVNTSENPADLVSRGLPAAELPTCDLWWHASPFLALDESEWPTQRHPPTHPAVVTSSHLFGRQRAAAS